MKQGLVRLLYNFGKRFMGWTLHMIMCVLLCYPVSIRIYYQQGVLFLVKSCLSGPETLQRPVSGPNSASCDGQLNCGSLHKQTRGNTLSGDVCTPVENHDLVPSFSHHIESQAHSRVSECDGRPTFQVESGTVDRMVTTSTGVQTDLPKVVHSPRGPICHSSEPQASTVRVSYPRPEGLGHRCSKHRLDGSHCLCLPSSSSPTTTCSTATRSTSTSTPGV